MSSNSQITLPAAPKLAFADLHQLEEIEDFTLDIYGTGEQARSGTKTIPATAQMDAAASACVPSGVPTSSLNPQATSFSPRPPPTQQLVGVPPAASNAGTTSRATTSKSSPFHQLCTLALQRALEPATAPSPTNFVLGETVLEPQHFSLANNFSSLFLGLATRRAAPLEAGALSAATAKHLAAIFASLAEGTPPSSHLSAIAKDSAFPVLAAAALQNAVS